ncbi:MAG: hypothetical protein HPY55_05930 [Firmicutes bacterium]|nr:hypothetical protein [Bacillota bacterium]
MDAASLAVTIIHGWLEFMTISAAGMATWGIRFDLRRLMIVGVIGTTAAQVIRIMPLRFGIHTILMMFVLLPLIYYMFRPPFLTASCATFGGFTLFLFVEEVVCFYVLRVLGIHIEDMLANIAMRSVFGLVTPTVLALYVMLVLWIRGVRTRRHASKTHPAA